MSSHSIVAPSRAPRRYIALAFVLLLALQTTASVGALPGVGEAGASPLSRPSVGTFAVSPSQGGGGGGVAHGSLVSGIVGSSDGSGAGTLRSLAVATPAAGGGGRVATTVFHSVDVEGFVPTSQLRGVGTSALQLQGDGLSLSLMDNVNSLLMIQADASRATDTQVTFVTAPDVMLTKDATLDHVLRVSATGEGAMQGALILVGNDGTAAGAAGSSLVARNAHEARATLAAGTQVIFRADTAYASAAGANIDQSAQTYDRAAVEAIARGQLVGEATTDFSGGANLLVNAQAFAFASARTSTASAQRVTTLLKTQATMATNAAAQACADATASAQGAGAAGAANAEACARAEILAYDLDYVDVPARTGDNVAVYIDGALAQRVAAAAEVASHTNAYWATTVDGRVLVLTNVAARAHAAHEVTIAAVADANAAASTLVQLDAEDHLTTEVAGGFEMLGTLQTSASGSGAIIGTFSSFLATEAKGDAGVRDITDIRSATQIFSKLEVASDVAADAVASFSYDARAAAAGRATGSASHAGGAVVEMTTTLDGSAVAVTRFTDSVFATIEAEALAATLVRFRLGGDVSARALAGTEKALQLDGPAGKVGYLILTRVDGRGQASGVLEFGAQNEVQARLAAGEAVIFRSAADARTRASAELIVDAIAQGALASETSVGFVANAVLAANVDYRPYVHTTLNTAADATHRGQATFWVTADAAATTQATLVSIVSDQATLAARDAADITVRVNGQVAVAAESAADVVAGAAAGAVGATYYATTSLQGQTQILLLVPTVAGSASSVVLHSDLEEQRRLDSALDVFGSFTAGYGGAARGDIVSLIARQEAGLLLDYTVAARSDASASEGTVTSVFDAVRLGASSLASTGAASSTALRFQNEQGSIEVFDVSGAVLKLAASVATSAEFDLAEGIHATALTPQVIMLSAPDFSGALILVDAAQATAGAGATGGAGVATSMAVDAGGRVVADLDAGAQVIFKAFSGFESQLTAAQREAQARAIASGAIIGQIIVRSDPVTHVTSATAVNYYPAVASSAVVGSVVNGGARASASYAGYGAVQAITQVASSEKVELVVTSATSAGKSLILSLDRHTVSGLVSGDAQLLVDGRRVPPAPTYEDALVADFDKYFLMTAGKEVGVEAVVTLAHFSTRTITLEAPPAPSVFLWTTIALGAIVVAQAVVPVVRRRLQ